jgi:hypothetical protein
MATKNHVSLNGTASAAAQSTEINAKSISWIANDGAYDITFNFEEAVTTSGAFKLCAGDVIENWEQPVGTIYYISTSGDCSFRFVGEAR